MFRFVRLSTFLGSLFAALICGAALVIASFYIYLAPKLPMPDQLKDIQLQTPLRIYTSDNKKIAEFGEKRRTPVDINQVPQQLIDAFIAAEDNRFFSHSGIDIKGLARATYQLVSTGKIVTGGSTITMQVAKNFFLSRERTFIRKFNEIFLAIQIEQTLSKNEILELYLNKIYLGNRAYGVQAAAAVYYGKELKDLSLAEMAMIAGLPKAPSRYNPLSNSVRARIRRDWILSRMEQLGLIDNATFENAFNTPLTASFHGGSRDIYAPYIAEMARLEAVEQFGSEAYTAGLNVYLTVNSEKQAAARKALRTGVESYDMRHGYRGPLGRIENVEQLDEQTISSRLKDFKLPSKHEAALITSIEEETLNARLWNQEQIQLNFTNAEWASPYIDVNRTGKKPTTWTDFLALGDVIQVKKIESPLPPANSSKEDTDPQSIQTTQWRLTQTPEAQAALVSINPQDGAVEALVGGYDFGLSNYNRATQAKRQPGSNFKPFIYLAGLMQGNTAATLINDAPIVFDDKNLEDVWRPENSSGRFYGPTRLRKALYNSRNLVSIRLLKNTGINNTLKVAKQFGFNTKELPRDLSLALGSAGMTPYQLAQGYAIIANGGYLIEPYLVERIESSEGEILYQSSPYKVCDPCDIEEETIATEHDKPAPIEATDSDIVAIEQPADTISIQTEAKPERHWTPAERVADPRALFILHSMLKDVITKGTGRRALKMNRNDLAGKTGTTNDQKDAWFSGYNSDIQTSVWVGFDNPSSLGRREYGAKAALPIWIDYMKVALADSEETDMARPADIVNARIDPETGLLARPGDKNAIFDVFRKEFAPTKYAQPEPQANEFDFNSRQTETIRPEDIF